MGKSTGENQILSLSFVASVSKIAQEVRQERSIEDDSEDWGEYPIVMDATLALSMSRISERWPVRWVPWHRSWWFLCRRVRDLVRYIESWNHDSITRALSSLTRVVMPSRQRPSD